ncbi:MAG: hypothetical protein GX630_04215 [Actinobacteria bacterium]|nr:hypothetical protein [Actinomycetota bacterium]
MGADLPLFHEVQRFRQWWLGTVVLGIAALSWWLFIRQIVRGQVIGDHPAPDWALWILWLVAGIALPAAFILVRLVLEVTDGEVIIRFVPLAKRVIRVDEIEKLEVRTYNAVTEYGGYGMKGWSNDKMAYNVGGNRGVELTLRDGRRVMLGSQRADELAAAIESQMGPAGRLALPAEPPEE